MAKAEMNIPNEFDAYESDDDFIFVESAIHEFDYDGEAIPNRDSSDFSWAAIESACQRLLEKGPDIRVVIWLIRAHLAHRSLGGLREAFTRLAEYLSADPTGIRPLAPDVESAVELHSMHLSWLASPEFVHQLGHLHPPTLSADLVEFTRGKNSMHPDYQDARQLDGDLEQIAVSLQQATEALEKRNTSLNANEAIQLINNVRAALNRNAASAAPTVALAAADVATPSPPSKPASETLGPTALPDRIASRQAVADTLERVSEYFRQYEPGHPALLFLSRVQRMLGANFEELLAELYADGPALAAQLGRPGSASK